MHTTQVKNSKYMLQTRKKYTTVQEPINKQNLEDISQYKLSDGICYLSYRVYNIQPTVCS